MAKNLYASTDGEISNQLWRGIVESVNRPIPAKRFKNLPVEGF